MGGLFSMLGGLVGNFVAPGLGGMIGAGLGDMMGGGGGGPEQRGYSQASQMYQPIIDQTKGSIGQYQNLLGQLGQNYNPNNPALQYQQGALQKSLAARGMGTSPTAYGQGMAPLIAQDYQNQYTRQLGQLAAYQPLMNMYSGAVGSQAGLTQGAGTAGQNMLNQNVAWGMGQGQTMAGQLGQSSIDWSKLMQPSMEQQIFNVEGW